MTVVREISSDALGLDLNTGGTQNPVDRILSMKATQQALQSIRETATANEETAAGRDREPPDRRRAPEFNFVTLDKDDNGALTVQEMIRMLPQLPPKDRPSLAERAIEAQALPGATQFAGPIGPNPAEMFLQRLRGVQTA